MTYSKRKSQNGSLQSVQLLQNKVNTPVYKTRITSFLILMLSVVLLLSACSTGSNARSEEQGTTKTATVTTIKTTIAPTSTPKPTSTPTPTPTPIPTPTPMPTPTPTPIPTLTPKQKDDTYIAATYKEYARNPDSYTGNLVKISGKVIQVLEEAETGGTFLTLRVVQDSDYDQVWMIGFLLPTGASRILEDDSVKIYGSFAGVTSYETVMGNTVTVPLIYADDIIVK